MEKMRHNDEFVKGYNPIKWNIHDCKPTLTDKDLMSYSGDYINEDYIKTKCNCTKANICFAILRALKSNDRE